MSIRPKLHPRTFPQRSLESGTPHLLPVFERLFLKGVMIDSDAQDLPIPGASIGTGTNRIPDIKTSIEMESIFVPDRSHARYYFREVPSVLVEERVRSRCLLGPAKYQRPSFWPLAVERRDDAPVHVPFSSAIVFTQAFRMSLHQAPIPRRSSVSSPTSAERVDSVESTNNLEERCDKDFQNNSAASPLQEAATCHAAVVDEGFAALEAGRLPQVGDNSLLQPHVGSMAC
jgi:hypothetical protein